MSYINNIEANRRRLQRQLEAIEKQHKQMLIHEFKLLAVAICSFMSGAVIELSKVDWHQDSLIRIGLVFTALTIFAELERAEPEKMIDETRSQLATIDSHLSSDNL